MDPLAFLVGACVLALALYVASLPPAAVFAPAGTVLTSGAGFVTLDFAVSGSGGRLRGAFAASNETWTWIHPAQVTSGHGTTARGVCTGTFDALLPPGRYAIWFSSLRPNLTLRITESVRVNPATAPSGTLPYGIAGGTPCPPQA